MKGNKLSSHGLVKILLGSLIPAIDRRKPKKLRQDLAVQPDKLSGQLQIGGFPANRALPWRYPPYLSHVLKLPKPPRGSAPRPLPVVLPHAPKTMSRSDPRFKLMGSIVKRWSDRELAQRDQDNDRQSGPSLPQPQRWESSRNHPVATSNRFSMTV